MKLPVDPTDQVMLRLKLLDALMDMSKFLLGFRGKQQKQKYMDLRTIWISHKRQHQTKRVPLAWLSVPAESVFNTYLLRWGHKVDGSVVVIIFLDETEGELVVDQEVVYLERNEGLRSLSAVQQYQYRRHKQPEVT